MKMIILTLTAIVTACWLGTLAARAHESPVPHAHPHLQTLDGALMGYDALVLIALALAAATGLTLFLVRRRK